MGVCKGGFPQRQVKCQRKEQYICTLASTLDMQATHQVHAQRLDLILLKEIKLIFHLNQEIVSFKNPV